MSEPKSQLKRIELDPSRPAWEKQPGETERRYSLFEAYRELGRGRSLTKAAEKVGLTPHYMRRLSVAGQWQVRIEAWNAHVKSIYDAEHFEAAQNAAREDAAMLRAFMSSVGTSVMTQQQSGVPLTPDQAAKWLDIALKYRRQLYGDPTKTPDQARDDATQQPVQVEVRQFSELPDEGKLNALRDLMAENQRWLTAATDEDDE